MQTSSVPAVELAHATKRYAGTLALDDVSLRVAQGETVALLGPNGAGKTTAISLMLGLRRPTSGDARILGHDPRTPAARARLGAMLQESGLPGMLQVREAIELFAGLYERPRPVAEAIALAELEHRATTRVISLSGGERQRLFFALALVGNPDVLFLDEPTAALDVETRRRLWEVVRGLVQQGCTILLTTHYLEEADALADRIVVIDRGRVVVEGTPAEIKARVGGRFVRFRCADLDEGRLCALAGVQRVSRSGDEWTLIVSEPEQVIAALFACHTRIERLEVRDAGLEEAFVALTGHAS